MTPESENRPKPRCPFCRSNDTEVISLFGSQVMTMQCKCHACGSFFEASKYSSNDHLFANRSLDLRPDNARIYTYVRDLSESQPMKETTSVGSRTPGPQGLE